MGEREGEREAREEAVDFSTTIRALTYPKQIR